MLTVEKIRKSRKILWKNVQQLKTTPILTAFPIVMKTLQENILVSSIKSVTKKRATWTFKLLSD